MGQRLVINMIDNDSKRLATAYYHWGGFTTSALQTAKKVALSLIETKNMGFSAKTRAITALLETGAKFMNEKELDSYIDSLPEDEREEERKGIGYNEQEVDRNDGLLTVTEKEMKDSWDIREQYITFIVGEDYEIEVVDFVNVFDIWTSLEAYRDWYSGEEGTSVDWFRDNLTAIEYPSPCLLNDFPSKADMYIDAGEDAYLGKEKEYNETVINYIY